MAEFDIEKFPTSPTAKQMLSRVSPVYTSSYIAKWLYEVMGRELDEARTLFIELIKQRFPDGESHILNTNTVLHQMIRSHCWNGGQD